MITLRSLSVFVYILFAILPFANAESILDRAQKCLSSISNDDPLFSIVLWYKSAAENTKISEVSMTPLQKMTAQAYLNLQKKYDEETNKFYVCLKSTNIESDADKAWDNLPENKFTEGKISVDRARLGRIAGDSAEGVDDKIYLTRGLFENIQKYQKECEKEPFAEYAAASCTRRKWEFWEQLKPSFVYAKVLAEGKRKFISKYENINANTKCIKERIAREKAAANRDKYANNELKKLGNELGFYTDDTNLFATRLKSILSGSEKMIAVNYEPPLQNMAKIDAEVTDPVMREYLKKHQTDMYLYDPEEGSIRDSLVSRVRFSRDCAHKNAHARQGNSNTQNAGSTGSH